MDTAHRARRAVHVVADSDSRWKWGATLARRIAPDAAVHGTLLDGPASPTDQQLRDLDAITADSVHRAGIVRTVDLLARTEADVIVFACVGGAVQALLQAVSTAWSGRASRPVVVTGYVGLVYERVVDGLVLRAGADVVLANSVEDAARFRSVFTGLGLDPDVIVPAALPFLDGAVHDAAHRDEPYTVTFVTQPGVPATRAERRYALDQVVEHARRHPQRRVLVKLRGRVGERTTHPEPYHYASLRNAPLPANVEFVYGPMDATLERTDLCVTVSSTAALEALHRGIATAVLTDFGVREALGNHAFLGSGVLTSWQRLHDGAVPVADPQWLARNGVGDSDPWPAVAGRVDALIEHRAALPALTPWLSAAGADSYLPDLLRRYGLDATGRPLDQAAVSTALHRRAMRASARRAYRVGVRAIEPRIRRMAHL